MSFQSPWLLLTLLLIPLAVLLYMVMQTRRSQYAVRFTNLELLSNVVAETPAWRRHLPPALYLLALGALLVALGRPGFEDRVARQEGNVILVTDVSGSMNAVDVEPSRLAAAQDAAGTFIDGIPGNFKIGIIAFSSSTQVLLAPSTDRAKAHVAIGALQANGGTAMGDAIVQALNLIRQPDAINGGPLLPGSGAPGAPAPRATPTPTPRSTNGGGAKKGEQPGVILLLSDGAQTLGLTQPAEAARQAKDLNVPVFTIALGTPNGVVDVRGPNGQMRRIPVPPDETTLQMISETTGGKFFSAPTAGQLKTIYKDLGTTVGYERETREVTSYFAALAALFLVGGGVFALRWFSRFP